MSAPQPGVRAVDLVFVFEAAPADRNGASNRALAWCGYHNMSVGRMQRDDPRGILFGDYDIQKWRNLSPATRRGLHGIFKRMPDGSVQITIRAAPVNLVIRHPNAPPPRADETPWMPSPYVASAAEVQP